MSDPHEPAFRAGQAVRVLSRALLYQPGRAISKRYPAEDSEAIG